MTHKFLFIFLISFLFIPSYQANWYLQTERLETFSTLYGFSLTFEKLYQKLRHCHRLGYSESLADPFIGEPKTELVQISVAMCLPSKNLNYSRKSEYWNTYSGAGVNYPFAKDK